MFLNDCDHILCIVDFLWVKKITKSILHENVFVDKLKTP